MSPNEREESNLEADLWGLDGPADDELELSGPGLGGEDNRLMADPILPGGVDPTAAAAGAGALGIALLGITAVLKRRSARRRYRDLDE